MFIDSFPGIYFLSKEHKLPVVAFFKYVIEHHIRNTFCRVIFWKILFRQGLAICKYPLIYHRLVYSIISATTLKEIRFLISQKCPCTLRVLWLMLACGLCSHEVLATLT